MSNQFSQLYSSFSKSLLGPLVSVDNSQHLALVLQALISVSRGQFSKSGDKMLFPRTSSFKTCSTVTRALREHSLISA